MDGIVMGGGMGISQGASIRVVTERTKMAMPETHIGLFPDVGGGYFLSRCPGHLGEWLALTGEVIDGSKPIACGLADRFMPSTALEAAWGALANLDFKSAPSATETVAKCLSVFEAARPAEYLPLEVINRHFSQPDVVGIFASLRQDSGAWAQHTMGTLQKQSPLMLHVTLQQIRRARHMSLADDLRMERDLVRHCFFPAHLGRMAKTSDTVEGIRALAVDKDHKPVWNPSAIEDVTPQMVQPFFDSPWPVYAHPLAGIA
jgi:enoyl-CoA hydratase